MSLKWWTHVPWHYLKNGKNKFDYPLGGLIGLNSSGELIAGLRQQNQCFLQHKLGHSWGQWVEARFLRGCCGSQPVRRDRDAMLPLTVGWCHIFTGPEIISWHLVEHISSLRELPGTSFSSVDVRGAVWREWVDFYFLDRVNRIINSCPWCGIFFCNST